MLSHHDIHESIRPLRLIFWGAVLCVVDFTFSQTTNGEGYRIDLLNDLVGAILIMIGITRLAQMPVEPPYGLVMRLVKVVVVLSIAETALKHHVFTHPAGLRAVFTASGLLRLGAILGFCLAMRWFALEAQLSRSVRSWRLTTILFLCIYVLPLGLFHLAGLVLTATGRSFHMNLGPAALLIIPVLLFPLIHLFISTSRMRREAGAGGEGGHGFPVIVKPDAAPAAVAVPALTAPEARPLAWWWFAVGVAMLIATAALASALSYLGTRDAITWLGGGTGMAQDGREYRIQAGGRDADRTRVIGIMHKSTPVTKTEDRGLRWSSDQPMRGPLSHIEVVCLWPPNVEKSGLWADGKKMPMDKPLTVMYTSDLVPATEIVIADVEQAEFISDLGALDGWKLIEKWITPRLPARPPDQ